MSPLPPDLIKIRNELVEEHKLLTKDNGIESSSYHFKAGFNACAEIFLKKYDEAVYALTKQIMIRDEEIKQLQARNKKLVEALKKILTCENMDWPRQSVMAIAREALAADKEPK